MFYLFLSNVQSSVSNILSNSGSKQYWFLAYNTNLFSQPFDVDISHIYTIYLNLEYYFYFMRQFIYKPTNPYILYFSVSRVNFICRALLIVSLFIKNVLWRSVMESKTICLGIIKYEQNKIRNIIIYQSKELHKTDYFVQKIFSFTWYSKISSIRTSLLVQHFVDPNGGLYSGTFLFINQTNYCDSYSQVVSSNRWSLVQWCSDIKTTIRTDNGFISEFVLIMRPNYKKMRY